MWNSLIGVLGFGRVDAGVTCLRNASSSARYRPVCGHLSLVRAKSVVAFLFGKGF